MSEMEKVLEELAGRATSGYSLFVRDKVAETLKELLPLLEAGADMRYQEWPEKMEIGPAAAWDAALKAIVEA